MHSYTHHNISRVSGNMEYYSVDMKENIMTVFKNQINVDDINILNKKLSTLKNGILLMNTIKTTYNTAAISKDFYINVINKFNTLLKLKLETKETIYNFGSSLDLKLSEYCGCYSSKNTPLHFFYMLIHRLQLTHIFITYSACGDDTKVVCLRCIQFTKSNKVAFQILYQSDKDEIETKALDRKWFRWKISQNDLDDRSGNNLISLLQNIFKLLYIIIPNQIGINNDFYIQRIDINKLVYAEGKTDIPYAFKRQYEIFDTKTCSVPILTNIFFTTLI